MVACCTGRSFNPKSRRSRGFVGFGDADPSNVSPLVRGAEMRVAETRAVNRALRKAYGIGLCSRRTHPPGSAAVLGRCAASGAGATSGISHNPVSRPRRTRWCCRLCVEGKCVMNPTREPRSPSINLAVNSTDGDGQGAYDNVGRRWRICLAAEMRSHGRSNISGLAEALRRCTLGV